jgi:hypothetical protein
MFFKYVQLAGGAEQVEQFHRLYRRLNGQFEGCVTIIIL